MNLRCCPSLPRLLLAATCAALLGGAAVHAGEVQARQPQPQPSPAAADKGPRWSQLTAAQREALRPLERDWANIDGTRKRKWLEIAARYPAMGAEEQERLHERMSDWVRLSPEQRRTARINFRDARDLSAETRLQTWDAYQALSQEERHLLAKQAARNAAAARAAARPEAQAAARQERRTDGPGKTNIVPNPSFATPAKPVAPGTLQAKPGVTTTPITKRPTPPWHQQPGMPKIAATPEFVDPHTLLPRVGPQGVDTIASEPIARPR